MSKDQILQLVYESGSLVIAFGIGVYAFQRMNLFFRLVFFQLSFWLICYCLSYLVTHYQRQNGLQMNNQWLMNLHLIGETLLLLTAAFIQIKEKPIRVIVVAASIAFLTIVGIQWLRTGIAHYFNMADVAECIIMTLFFSYILYKAIVDRKKDKRNNAVILVCIGLLIYFACSVPFIALLDVIQKNDPDTSSFLFHLISDVIAALRYLFLAGAFLVISRKAIHLNHNS